jgi:hypothetical protein
MSQLSRQAEYVDTRSSELRREVRSYSEQQPRFELSVPKVLAGALAAASAAVAASWLGVAGTVLGAVVASVVVSVTSAVYSHPLERSTRVIREVLPLRLDPDRLPSNGSTHPHGLDRASDTQTDRDDDRASDDAPDRPRRRIAWRPVLASSLLVLAVGLGLLTGFEAILGRSAGSLTGNGEGGTTFSRIIDDATPGGRSNNEQPTTPTPTTGPDDGSSTSTQPTQSPSTEEPTTTEPTTPEPTPTQPTDTATEPANTGTGADSETGQDGADGAAPAAQPAG